MKLKMKEWVAKMTKAVGKYDTPQTVSFPFTATKDGIATAVAGVPTSAAAWLFISEDGNDIARAMSSGGVGISCTFPVVKGKQYKISTSSNIRTPSVTVKPFMGGYCVTQLLQRLQPFPRLEVA